MTERAKFVGLAVACLLLMTAQRSSALNKRVQIVQEGDFLLIGNTLAQDCGDHAPAAVVGTTTCSMAGELNDLSPDIFWRAEGGSAVASSSITPDDARSIARLDLPPGAEVTHAYLYWSALNPDGPDNAATIECVGSSPKVAQAMSTLAGVDSTYQAAADVTEYVKASGSCQYLVGGVSAFDFKTAAKEKPSGYAAWWMVVLYKRAGAPHKQLTVYDGFDAIGSGAHSPVTVDNLLVPPSFATLSKAYLGVVAYEGDKDDNGDRFFVSTTPFDAARPDCGSGGDPLCVALKDCGGDEKNFFNSTRCSLGKPLSVVGDLPQLTGGAASMNRIDMDVFDVTSLLTPGQAKLSLDATSVEAVSLAGVITSIPAFTDADMDGLSDDEEAYFGTDPGDADDDDDGVPDGKEGCSNINFCPTAAWSVDSDGDGLINALDPDSDNDGLYDGTELGQGCGGPGTDAAKQHCVADANPGTLTDPLNADTDGGGVNDGSEDFNRNGGVDEGETDPTAGHNEDDAKVIDSDDDGLSDGFEAAIGSNPTDADSDDDGVPDGKEANVADDTDKDGAINALDADSDGDGIFDGTERGYTCDSPAIDAAQMHCVPDGDEGETTTSMVDRDTDDGGVIDGDEDFNKNGVLDVEQGEGDPNNADDDGGFCSCADDSACGAPGDGFVCVDCACKAGCRKDASGGCPAGHVCTATDDTVGECVSDVPLTIVETVTYDGCICGVGGGSGGSSGWYVFAAGCASAIYRRRRR